VRLYPFFIRSMAAAAKRHAAQPHEHEISHFPDSAAVVAAKH
jgi:hypothetical protein